MGSVSAVLTLVDLSVGSVSAVFKVSRPTQFSLLLLISRSLIISGFLELQASLWFTLWPALCFRFHFCLAYQLCSHSGSGLRVVVGNILEKNVEFLIV